MKISIITASYNYEQYISDTINSVLNQDYTDWELIVVDDGSSDNSVEIIKEFCKKDERIKLFQHEKGQNKGKNKGQNKGLKETLLLGISKAQGDWIAFLESDDVFMPNNLSKKIEIINKHPEAKLIFNKVEFLTEETRPQQKIFEKTQNKLSKQTYPRNMFKDFFINNQILTFSCVMIESQALKSADFNSPVDSLLDWWLWVNISYKNLFYYIDEELTKWRLHPSSYVTKSKKPILYTVQSQAYKNVYEKISKPLWLLLFIVYSNIKLFCVRVFRLLKRIFMKNRG